MTKKLHEENSCNLWPIPSADMQWVSRGGRETPTLDLTFNPGHKSLARVTLNFMLFLTQTAIGYEEWWVEGVPSKMLKQRVKKTKAEPSGHKKKTKPKNKQLASLTHTAVLYKYSNTFVNFTKNSLKMSHTIEGQRTQQYCSFYSK